MLQGLRGGQEALSDGQVHACGVAVEVVRTLGGREQQRKGLCMGIETGRQAGRQKYQSICVVLEWCYNTFTTIHKSHVWVNRRHCELEAVEVL